MTGWRESEPGNEAHDHTVSLQADAQVAHHDLKSPTLGRQPCAMLASFWDCMILTRLAEGCCSRWLQESHSPLQVGQPAVQGVVTLLRHNAGWQAGTPWCCTLVIAVQHLCGHTHMHTGRQSVLLVDWSFLKFFD